MGRETKNFRQSKRENSGQRGNQNYAKINRQEGWNKPINIQYKKGVK